MVVCANDNNVRGVVGLRIGDIVYVVGLDESRYTCRQSLLVFLLVNLLRNALQRIGLLLIIGDGVTLHAKLISYKKF